MGYDTDRFEDTDINEELICVICAGVLEQPMTTHCDHLFCKKCIEDWLQQHNTCPIDRCPLRMCMLKDAPRVIRNLINRLRINCPYRSMGCQQSIRLEQLTNHRRQCEYNPKAMVQCTIHCGKMMLREEMQNHNCVDELQTSLLRANHNIWQLENQIKYLNKCLTIITIVFLIMYFLLPLPTVIINTDRLFGWIFR